MSGHTCLLSVALLVLPFCSVARAQLGQPTKYATIEPDKKQSFGQVLFSPAGDRLLLSSGKSVATWDVKTKQQHKLTYKADNGFLDTDYSPDGRMLVAAEFSKLYQIEVSTGQRTFLYQHNDGSKDAPGDVSFVKYSSDGKQILSADRSLRVWDVEKKAEVRRIDPGGFVVGLAWIPGTDNVLVHVSLSTKTPKGTTTRFEIRLVNLKTGKLKTILDETPLPMSGGALAVSRDGKLFAFANGTEVSVLATETWKAEAIPKCPIDPDHCLFSESGRFLIVGGSTKGVPTLFEPAGEVAILDRVKNKWISHFSVLNTRVMSMALSPKGDLLAVSSSKSRAVTVWDLSPVTGKLPKK